MLATVRNISPCIEQAASQVSCLLLVASRAKTRRPVPVAVCVDDLVISARKASRSAGIAADLFPVGSIFDILASFELQGIAGDQPPFSVTPIRFAVPANYPWGTEMNTPIPCTLLHL